MEVITQAYIGKVVECAVLLNDAGLAETWTSYFPLQFMPLCEVSLK